MNFAFRGVWSILCVFALSLPAAHATIVQWDPGDTGAAGGSGGAGTWNTIDSFWETADGTTNNQAFAVNDEARFNAPAGIVVVNNGGATLNVGSISLSINNYDFDPAAPGDALGISDAFSTLAGNAAIHQAHDGAGGSGTDFNLPLILTGAATIVNEDNDQNIGIDDLNTAGFPLTLSNGAHADSDESIRITTLRGSGNVTVTEDIFLTVNGDNGAAGGNYTGNWTVNAASGSPRLIVAHNNALGVGSAGTPQVTLTNTDASIQLSGDNRTVELDLIIADSGNQKIVRGSGVDQVLNGTIRIDETSTNNTRFILDNANTLTVNSQIVDNVAGGNDAAENDQAIFKDGNNNAGTVIFTNALNDHDRITLDRGNLRFTNRGAMGDLLTNDAIRFQGADTKRLQIAFNNTSAADNITGNIRFVNDGNDNTRDIIEFSGGATSAVFTGNIINEAQNVEGANNLPISRLLVDANETMTFTGNFSGDGGLLVGGSGGTVRLEGNYASTGGVVIQTSTLQNAGTLDQVNVRILSGLLEGGSGTVEYGINDLSQTGLITMTGGTLDISTMTLDIVETGLGATQMEYVLVDYSAGGTLIKDLTTVFGTLGTIPTGYFVADTGTQVVLTTVPEPGTLVLATFGLGTLGVCRLRRHRRRRATQ